MLQLIAALLWGWLALCVFTLHIISSPKRRNWATIPEYVRGGFLVTGVMATWRSVNLIDLADQPAAIGRINAEGMLALLAITYTVTALAWWTFRRVLPGRWWERLGWMEHEARSHPNAAPVILEAHELADVSRATGVRTASAGEGAEAVVREGRRGRGL